MPSRLAPVRPQAWALVVVSKRTWLCRHMRVPAPFILLTGALDEVPLVIGGGGILSCLVRACGDSRVFQVYAFI